MDRRSSPFDGRDVERRGPDFLSQVREICRLRVDQDPSKAGTEIVERSHGRGGAAFDHLVVRYTRGPFPAELLVGAHDGPLGADDVARFRDGVCDPSGTERGPELVHRGPASPGAISVAGNRVWLRSFDEYQRVWRHHDYVAAQTRRLHADPEYPLARHVDKRWSELDDPGARPTTAAEQIMTWLRTDGPRFVLVLGDFGTGKTFLLRALADRLAGDAELVPVLVTMRELTKGRTLDELLAQHMAAVDSYHRASFRYLLRHGRIVLLFDGFDELAQRIDYDRVVAHFDTLREAADGAAKVVVTSRHQYFATDRDVRTALGGQAQALPGSRIMRLLPLDPSQRRTLAVEDFDDEAAAEHFLGLLGGVRDLLGLAENPRMLRFMIRWYREGLFTDAELTEGDRPVTAGLLYARLLRTWLEHEVARLDEPGGATPPSVDEWLDAVGEVALRLWRSGADAVRSAELGSAAATVVDLARLQMQPGEAAQAVGSGTVLVRVGEDMFGFIHRSVLEWMVARWAAQVFLADASEDRLAEGPLSELTVDFLCDLAGDDTVIGWASRVVRGEAEPVSKVNAARVLQRRGFGVAAADYAGLDLRGQDLSNQNLEDANLRAANLSGAVLPQRMHGANLRGARLVEARLDRADLRDADLRDADLCRARLIGADLRTALLNGARLDRAVLVGAVLDPDALRVSASSFGAAFDGKAAQPQLGAGSAILALACMAGVDLLASGHADGSVRLWDPDTGTALRTLTGHSGGVQALAVDPTGCWLASGGADGSVRLWDLGTGTELRTLIGHASWVRALAVDPTGKWLAAGGDDGGVRLWDPSTGTTLRTLTGHPFRVRALAVDPTGKWLAAGGDQGSVRLWDPRTGTTLRTLTGHSGGVEALAVDPSGRWLASGDDDDGSMQLWDPSTGTALRTFTGHTHGVQALAVSPAGRWLASGSIDGSVQLWDPGTGTALRTLSGHSGGIGALAVDPSGRWLASGDDDDGSVRLWDPSTGTRLRTLTGHTRGVQALAIDPTGQWLASGSIDGSVQLWDLGTGKGLRTLTSHTRAVWALAVGPAGRWLAAGSIDGSVQLWDPALATRLRTLTGHPGGVQALAADPAGRWLAAGSADGSVRLWNPNTGEPLATLVASEDGWAALLPDGSYKLAGRPADLWWAIGLCRFEATDLPDLAPYQPHLRKLPDDAPILPAA